MQTGDIPPAQYEPHHWPKKIGGHIVRSPRRLVSSPDMFRLAIHHKACPIRIGKLEAFCFAVLGENERGIGRACRFGSAGKNYCGKHEQFSDPVRFRTVFKMEAGLFGWGSMRIESPDAAGSDDSKAVGSVRITHRYMIFCLAGSAGGSQPPVRRCPALLPPSILPLLPLDLVISARLP